MGRTQIATISSAGLWRIAFRLDCEIVAMESLR